MPKTPPPFNMHFDIGFSQFQKYIEHLAKGGIKDASSNVLEIIARRTQRLVQIGYMGATFKRMPATLDTYAFGKLRGKELKKPWNYARRKWSGKSLYRSGQLAAGVIVTKSGKFGRRIEIDPNKRYVHGDETDIARGLRLVTVAEQLENPVPVVVKVTVKMLRYLHAMDPRRGETPTVQLGENLIITQEKKPVWEPATRHMQALKPLLHTIFAQDMLRRKKNYQP